jgi:hypothetical protein
MAQEPDTRFRETHSIGTLRQRGSACCPTRAASLLSHVACAWRRRPEAGEA